MDVQTPLKVADELRARSFAVIAAYLRGDLDGVLALVGDDDVELLPITVEILTVALTKLISREEISRQIDEWLEERRTQLAGLSAFS
jgi:hypothetical protein